MPMASFYTPWKHKKTFGFLMFLGGIERDQWHENGLMYVWYFHIIIGSKLVKTRWLRSGKLPPCHQITLNAKETTIDMPVSPSGFNSQLRWNQPLWDATALSKRLAFGAVRTGAAWASWFLLRNLIYLTKLP